MKLIINLTLSLILVFLSAFTAANTCCCVGDLAQPSSQKMSMGDALQDASAPSCHDAMQQNGDHSHVKCQCDHHGASSVPSIITGNTVSQLDSVFTLIHINTPLLSHTLDNIYRPPITA